MFATIPPVAATIDSGVRPEALTLSPDGKTLAFISVSNGCAFTLWRVNIDGSALVQVTPELDYDIRPAWSADRSGVCAVAGHSWTPLPVTVVAPPSSGRTAILECTEEGLWLVEDGKRRQLPIGGNITDPIWSPDGKMVYCASTWFRGVGDNGDSVYYGDIYAISADGSSVRRLTSFAPLMFRSTKADVVLFGVIGLWQVVVGIVLVIAAIVGLAVLRRKAT